MTYSEIRRRARVSLRNNWLIMILICFINYMLLGLFSSIVSVGLLGVLYGIIYNIRGDAFISGWREQLDKRTIDLIEKNYGENGLDAFERAFGNISKACGEMIPVLVAIIIIGIVLLAIVGSMMTAGMYKSYYNVAVGEEVRVRDLFSNIRIWPKMLLISIIRYGAVYVVYIATMFIISILGSAMLFVLAFLPIIFLLLMVLFEFIMAPFVLIDNQELGSMACLRSGANIMKGYKVKTLVLTLTFFGWFLLYCVLSMLSVALLPVLSILLYSMLTVYVYVAYTHYYLHITGQDRYMEMEYNQTAGFINGGMYSNQESQFQNNVITQPKEYNSVENNDNINNNNNNNESLESKADKLIEDKDDLENSLDLVDDFIDFDV